MSRIIYLKRILIGVAVLLAGVIYWLNISSPSNYPSKTIINIRNGAGLLEVSKTLEKNNIIRSSFWFRTAAIVLGGERGLQAGDYYLSKRENAFKLASRIVRGKKNIETIRVTIPEGFTNLEIGALFDKRFPRFDQTEFLELAKEGYMFPDTYFIEISSNASTTINLLNNNFTKKLASLEGEIASSSRSFGDIIKMASILEEEAITSVDRKIISGILWKRMDIGMALQVDATLKYITGRGSAELTKDDLKLNSPYNSYNRRGLPPTPISNPGLDSIEAALRPQKSDYLYFLTSDDGVMHYAKSFEEHKRNKEKYIKN